MAATVSTSLLLRITFLTKDSGGGDIPKRFNRALCAPNNVDASTCQWGPTTKGKACNSVCPKGWITLTKNSHVGGEKGGCKSGRYAPICCQTVTATSDSRQCFASTADHIFSGSLAARQDTSGVTSYSFDTSNLDDSAGEDDDDDDDAATASSAKRKRNERNLKGHGENSLSNRMEKRLNRRSFGSWAGRCAEEVTLPLGSIPIDVPALMIQSYAGAGTWNLELEPITVSASSSKKARVTITVPIQVESTSYDRTTTRTCSGDKYPQACLNYRSISQYGQRYATPTCANRQNSIKDRPLTKLWNQQHNTKAWFPWLTKSYMDPSGNKVRVRPQRDEWPPAHFMQGETFGYVRLLPGAQNEGVPNDGVSGWRGFCKYPPDKQVKVEGGPINVIGDVVYVTEYTSTITTLKVMNYEYTNMPIYAGDPDGLINNVGGWPSTLTDDPGFALLAGDPYFPQNAPWIYKQAPSAAMTAGKTTPKRDVWFNDELSFGIVDTGNSSRRATKAELFDDLGILQCDGDCEEERGALEILGLLGLTDAEAKAEARNTNPTSPAGVDAEPTGILATTTKAVGNVTASPASPIRLDSGSSKSSATSRPPSPETARDAGSAKHQRHVQVHAHKGHH